MTLPLFNLIFIYCDSPRITCLTHQKPLPINNLGLPFLLLNPSSHIQVFILLEKSDLPEVMFILNSLIGLSFVDFFVDFSNNGLEIIFILELQLLMVASALIRGALLQYFRESKKYFGFPPWGLGEEIVDVFLHKT